jgi:hypothetical protein
VAFLMHHCSVRKNVFYKKDNFIKWILAGRMHNQCHLPPVNLLLLLILILQTISAIWILNTSTFAHYGYKFESYIKNRHPNKHTQNVSPLHMWYSEQLMHTIMTKSLVFAFPHITLHFINSLSSSLNIRQP